jgi:hypothetical protein
MDELTKRCQGLLRGSYDCVDRIVLNAYFWLGHNPGGFRNWWRSLHSGGDDQLDNTHLMRMAGRLSRRVRAFAKARGIPLIDCGSEDRKHEIAEEHLASHEVGTGLFMILVARAPATTWEVQRNKRGVICNLAKRRSYVNHCSFHIMDPTWGHVTIKMAGHPPFDAQVMLNGHEYVAAQATAAGIDFRKEGNCFTLVPDPTGLAEFADTLSLPEAIGRLSQVAARWIYSTCLCFALNADEIESTRFTYSYSVYQVEYSRNLIFADGSELDELFGTLADRIRSRIDVPTLRTLFGLKKRPRRKSWGKVLKPREAVVIETPAWDLTVFKVHFGLPTLKGYTKGEHVARFEAITHNTRALQCGRTLDRFPEIVAKLRSMTDRFTTMLAGLRPNRLSARWDPRRATDPVDDRGHPGGRRGLEQAEDAQCPGWRPGLGGGPGRVHRLRVRRQGPIHDRPNRGPLQHPPDRLRPAQAPGQASRGQAGPFPPLRRAGERRPHHWRPQRAARPGDRPHPRRTPS